jgi:hypothetical protein
MEFRDILTGEMKPVDPEKQIEKKTLDELMQEIEDMKKRIEELESKGV